VWTGAAIVGFAVFEATAFAYERVWPMAPIASGIAVGAGLGGSVLTARWLNRRLEERALLRRDLSDDMDPYDSV
jgi:hypothetical protein